MARKGPLVTLERVKELLDYDPETGHFRWRPNIPHQRRGLPAGRGRGDGYGTLLIDKRGYPTHRVAWLFTHGHWPEGEIDHINGVRSDNRIANLRDVNRSENRQNQRRAQRNNKSGFLGVFWLRNRWQACIMLDKKTHYVGRYHTPEEAYEAYLADKAKLHPCGEIANEQRRSQNG